MFALLDSLTFVIARTLLYFTILLPNLSLSTSLAHSLSLSSSPQDWDSITVIILESDPGIYDEVDVFFTEAFNEGRLSRDYSGIAARSQVIGTHFPDGVLGR